jgi:DNA-binding transcriptional LysR family regulator
MNSNEPSFLTPEALQLIAAVAEKGSFAAAAHQLGVVPSAVTYRIRQLEDQLDVLLFDRSGRNAQLTDAGRELLTEGSRILADLRAVAARVKRVATGWEPQLTIAVDSIVQPRTLHELVADFLAEDPPTQLKLQAETLSGTWHALVSGKADLALGPVTEGASQANVRHLPLGEVPFVFAVSPNHPLALAAEPLADALLAQHRAVAVADTNPVGPGVTVGLLPGQRVLTVSDLPAKLAAQLRGLGSGFLPECMARPYLDTGRLVEKRTERPARIAPVSYAWRVGANGQPAGKALAWWLARLADARTRRALLYV